MINERELGELYRLVQDLRDHVEDHAAWDFFTEEEYFEDILEAMEAYIGIVEQSE